MRERKATAGAGSGKLPLSLFGLHEGESNGSKIGELRIFAGERGSKISRSRSKLRKQRGKRQRSESEKRREYLQSMRGGKHEGNGRSDR